MANWYKETENRILELKKQGYYNNWIKREENPITFLFEPGIKIEEWWVEKRKNIYLSNAKLLKVNSPMINFYVYPSKEFGDELGLIPALTFIEKKEIHGHLNQSPGHELTHILLREVNSYDNFPGGGVWSEGLCTFLDGNKIDRRKHVCSIKNWEEIIKISWIDWRIKLPDNIYPVGASIMQYIEENFGWNFIFEFIKNLKDYGSNEEEISIKIFKKKYLQLQNDWREWIIK